MYPYAADTDALIPAGLTQEWAVRASHPSFSEPLELEVEACTLGWDERRAPRVQASLSCRLPDSQAFLDALDARAGIRLEFDAGYLRPDGTRDVHTLAFPGLMDRDVDRVPGADTLELTAWGDEALVLANVPAHAFTPAQGSVDQAVRALLTKALPYAPTMTGTLPAGVPGELLTLEPGGDYWGNVEDLSDRVGGDVYDNGLRTWILEPRPVLAGKPASILRTGPGGTIKSSTTSLSRLNAGWANSVLIVYRWTGVDGVEHTIHGRAAATSGPYAVTNPDVGRVTYREDRPVPTTQADADAAAAALLPRLLARGRTYRVRTLSRYWLRPGHTVPLRLPLGTQERALVVAATYDLPAGHMDLDLRLPDTETTITTGE